MGDQKIYSTKATIKKFQLFVKFFSNLCSSKTTDLISLSKAATTSFSIQLDYSVRKFCFLLCVAESGGKNARTRFRLSTIAFQNPMLFFYSFCWNFFSKVSMDSLSFGKSYLFSKLKNVGIFWDQNPDWLTMAAICCHLCFFVKNCSNYLQTISYASF